MHHFSTQAFFRKPVWTAATRGMPSAAPGGAMRVPPPDRKRVLSDPALGRVVHVEMLQRPFFRVNRRRDEARRHLAMVILPAAFQRPAETR